MSRKEQKVLQGHHGTKLIRNKVTRKTWPEVIFVDPDKKCEWNKFEWNKFEWNKFKWNKFKWNKFKWNKFEWNKFEWKKFEFE